MKRRTLLIVSISFVVAVMTTPLTIVNAQGPPPPPSGETTETGHGFTENRPPADGGTAPLGSGLVLMLAMGAGYGVYKYRKLKKDPD